MGWQYNLPMSKTLANALKAAIIASGKSANEIAKATEIPQPTITRFLQGADMRLSRAEKIAQYLGLELKKR